LTGLFLVQLAAMAVPLGIFLTRKKAGKFEWSEADVADWPVTSCCNCSGEDYLGGVLQSHIICVGIGGLIPFCGLPCIPVVWLWSFV